MNVAAWLNRLGLEQYEQAFRENDVDAEVLPELTAEDLIGLGVTSIGHRRKLLAAIAALREKHPPANEETAPTTTLAPQEPPRDLAPSSAERRQLTVMFCDLVGSTELSAGLDPAVPTASAIIPATLQASLAARLDRLGAAKEIAQIGAVIGREFSYELLRELTSSNEAGLAVALDHLVGSELVSRRGVPPTASYVFKHALVQEAAHETLLRTERRRLHARIADLLEQRAEVMERQPELLAQHYAEAGINDKAVDYWTKAGKRSVARSAMAEAEAQFEKALARLTLLPATRERHYKELLLQADLGATRFAVRGWAAPETGRSYARAAELWEQLGYPSELP